jgi:RHS repeat-associated protein
VGSLKVVSDASGNIIKRIDYDAFGNIIADSNVAFAIPFGFAGGLHDRDTGFVRFGYRDYDPSTGRWTAKDPIGFAGGDADLYGYVLNNPVNFVDPTGEIWIQVAGGVIGAAINAYNSRNLYAKSEYGRFWASTGVGAITGATAALGSSFVGGMLAGGLCSQANLAADHVIRRDPCRDLDTAELDSLAYKMIISGLKGATGGFIGGAGTFAGKVFNLPGMRNLTSKNAGAITGAAAGAAASISIN